MVELRCILLDVDNTFYRSQALSTAYSAAMIRLTATLHGVGYSRAQQLIGEAKQTIAARGSIVSSTRALLELGCSIDEWIEFSCHEVDPRSYLQEDLRMRSIIDWLSRHYVLAIVSNNNRTQVERTLEAVGLSDVLAGTIKYTLTETKRLKPDTSIYHEILGKLQVSPDTALAVGDRDAIDLVPAREIGMHTYLVKSLEDMYHLDRYLIDRANNRK